MCCLVRTTAHIRGRGKSVRGNGEMLVNGEEKKQTNTVVLVRKRTIPTERPPLVGAW
jgi:hypothetical protein